MTNQYIAILTAVALSGCSGPPIDESSSAIKPLQKLVGHYVSEPVQSLRWIDEINFHTDGTFEASFGDGLSDLSGHLFTADGTYSINQGASKVSFTYDGVTDVYSFRTSSGLQMMFLGDDPPTDDTWFTLDPAPRPTTLDFAADSSPHDIALPTDGSILVIYDAHRDSCPVGSDTPVTLLAATDGNFGAQQGVELPKTPVDGTYRGLFAVPPGQNLSMWFSLVGPSCHNWDSNYGHNYDFEIVTP